MERPHAILFDVDGTLVETGGAGGESWRRAFRDLYDLDAGVKLFSEVGETDPVVGRRTFEGLLRPRHTRGALPRCHRGRGLNAARDSGSVL